MTPTALVAHTRSAAPGPAPARPERPEEAEDAVRHRTFWEAIQRHWRTVLGATAAGLAVAGLYAATAPREYEASTTLRATTPAARGPRDVGRAAAEVEALRGRVLAGEVVDSLGLRLVVDRPAALPRGVLVRDVRAASGEDQTAYTLRRTTGRQFAVAEAGSAQVLGTVTEGRPARVGPVDLTLGDVPAAVQALEVRVIPRAAAVERVQRGTWVSAADPATGVLTVRYRDADPALARDVLGAYVARQQARNRAAQAAHARGVAAGIRAQLDSATRALAAAEQAVRAFRERERVVDTKEEASAQVRQVVDLQAQRDALEAERRTLTPLLTAVRSGRGQPGDYQRLLGSPGLLQAPAAGDLLRQLGELTVGRDAGAGSASGAVDAPAVAVRRGEIEAQVEALARTYLAGLRRQIASLNVRRAAAEAELARIPGREADLARLQRAPEALSQVVAGLQARLTEVQLAEGAAAPGLEVVDAPTASARPVSPRPLPNLGLGLLVGLVAGSGLAVARDRRDRSVRSRGDLRLAANLPVLSAVPVIAPRGAGAGAGPGGSRLRAGVRHLVRGDGPAASAAPGDLLGEIIDTADPVLDDAYARLYLNVLQRAGNQARSILVASPLPGEGRTTTAVGLAMTLARRGVRVALLDADLRGGTLAQDYFGLSPNATGLADVLRGTVPLKSGMRVFRVDERASLTYMSAGRAADRDRVVLDAGAMRLMLTQFSALFEAIVVDSPPLNFVADGALLATLTDAVVLVGRAGVTDTAALGEAAEQLRGLGARVVGTILNAVNPQRDPAMRQLREYHRLLEARGLRTLARTAAPAEAPEDDLGADPGADPGVAPVGEADRADFVPPAAADDDDEALDAPRRHARAS